MQAQDESFKPKGRQFSFYGEALNSGKGAMWHGAFWAATGFISCAAANRMMNRRAMTWPWMHVLMAAGGGTLGASYGQWSQDTMFWIRRQKDALTRLPVWAQVVDEAGESVSDGSLQVARLQRLRDAIVAADEADFLELGASTDAAKFARELEFTELGKAASRSMVSDELVLNEASTALGPAFAELTYALAMAPAAARSDFFAAARKYILAGSVTTKPRQRSADEIADTIMAKARLAALQHGVRLADSYRQAFVIVNDKPELVDDMPPHKQALLRKFASCVTRSEQEAVIVREDGSKTTVARPAYELNAVAKQQIADAMIETAEAKIANLRAYVTLGSDPAFYAAQLALQSKSVRKELAARAEQLKEVQDKAAAEAGASRARGAAVAAEVAELKARVEAEAKNGLHVERVAAQRMHDRHRALTTVTADKGGARCDRTGLRAVARAWMAAQSPAEEAERA